VPHLSKMLEHLTPWSPDAEVLDESNKIKIDDLRITFRRTIRVPDNHESSDLPPDMGKFPLYKVDKYADRLPINMTQKGGVFLPMYQKEAMWIGFESRRRYAIKVFVGGINAISGEPAVPNSATSLRRRNLIKRGKSVQDYVVVGSNGQKWLDGVAVEPGKVRQFVAMPVGTGHSVEAQMTGQETTAGIQFEISRLDMKPDELSLSGINLSEIEIPEVNDSNRISVTVKTLTGKHIPITASHDTTILGMKFLIQLREGMPTDQQRLIFEGRQLEDGKTLKECNITDGSKVHLILRLRGGYLPPDPEMNIAAGGLITQSIARLPRGDYKKTVPITFNVQVLNSAGFNHVTGKEPPRSPVSAKTYADAGYPFFSMYEEPTTIDGDFQGLKSIAQIDGVDEESMPTNIPVVKIGAVGLLNPCGSDQELELEWELEERVAAMRTVL
jgi:hypothetical protein